MNILNTTYNIETSIEQDWINYIKETHIDLCKQTGLIIDTRFCKVLVEEEMEGKTYSLQLAFKNKEDLVRFKTKFFDKIHTILLTKYLNKVVFFSIELQEY